MNFELIQATPDDKEILTNLMQFYIYDFSEFVLCDVEEDGRFAAYPSLDAYWQEENHRFPYLIKQDGKNAGFVLVRYIETEGRSYFSIAEFFIMKKYRRVGMGKEVAKKIFHLHKGDWEVFQLLSNGPAQAFWTKVIDEYTSGNFTERIENGRRYQDFVS